MPTQTDIPLVNQRKIKKQLVRNFTEYTPDEQFKIADFLDSVSAWKHDHYEVASDIRLMHKELPEDFKKFITPSKKEVSDMHRGDSLYHIKNGKYISENPEKPDATINVLAFGNKGGASFFDNGIVLPFSKMATTDGLISTSKIEKFYRNRKNKKAMDAIAEENDFGNEIDYLNLKWRLIKK